jgi:hypothetical protein
MKRIHVPNMGPDAGTIPKAIAIGIRECEAIGAGALTIITPAKNNLDSIVIGDFLGHDVAKSLMKGDSVPVGDRGVELRHESVATVRKIAAPKVGLAFYVSEDAIRKLDDIPFDCLIFVPWLDEDGEQWANKWNAETFQGKTEGAEIDLPHEVIDALKALTNSVNLSTSIGHPFDKEHAKRKFSELRSRGIHWRPTELEKWAVRNRWRAADAKELSELSARYI